ncbi:hypothetical protein ACI1G1_000314 [Vibrio cholerae]|nr:hypothetical protein [Vibrio cholerae]
MQVIDCINFQHKGKTFEIKVFQTSDGFKVISYLNNQQVSPSYNVSLETNIDYFMQHKESLVAQLVGIACSDIQHEMYIKL